MLGSLAEAVKERRLPSLTILWPMGARDGGALDEAMKLAARGVGVGMKEMEALPSGKRPWLTSLVCGPKVTASTVWPSGAKRPIASPPALSLKLACRSALNPFWAVSLSAQTSK